MDKAINLNISGIKCDNKDCDFADTNVPVEEYENWLNKPCPKRGANLLTQEDYDSVKLILQLVESANKIFPPCPDDEMVRATLDFDGTGKVDIKISDIK